MSVDPVARAQDLVAELRALLGELAREDDRADRLVMARAVAAVVDEIEDALRDLPH